MKRKNIAKASKLQNICSTRVGTRTYLPNKSQLESYVKNVSFGKKQDNPNSILNSQFRL